MLGHCYPRNRRCGLFHQNNLIRPFEPYLDTQKPFDCGKADLNGFLRETNNTTPNASLFETEHLAKTYVVEDAYLDAEEFYSKCDFRPLVIPNPEEETILMYFDLKGITTH